MIESVRFPGGWWIRFAWLGWAGLWFGTYSAMPELFSERNGLGYPVLLRFGRWGRLKLLNRITELR